MYQMNSKIHARKMRHTPQEGVAMKTASLTAPLYLSTGKSRLSPLRYLPHVLVAALLVALLALASHNSSEGGQPTDPVVTHMGQH